MAKKESTFLNMILTLFVTTLLASTALGLVYKVTKEPIRIAKLEAKKEAIMQVVPEFDNSPIESQKKVGIDGDSVTIYMAKKQEVLVGTAIETYTKKGFAGMVKLMVGFKPDGSIFDISVLEHKETPGLGDKMEKEKSTFSLQFKDQNPSSFILKVEKDGGNVDAITAATISSRAYCDAVDRAYKVFQNESNIK